MTSTEPKFQQSKSVFEFDPTDWAEESDYYAPYTAARVVEHIKHILDQKFPQYLTTDNKVLEPQSTNKNAQLSEKEELLLAWVALTLATHLYEVYEYKLGTTLYKEGLEAIDTSLPHLQVDTNEKGPFRLTLNLTLDDDFYYKIAEPLKQPIEALFQGSGIWHECYRSILTSSFPWAMEAIEKDLGVTIPDSEDEYEEYARAVWRYWYDSDCFKPLYKLYSHEITRFLVREMDLPNRSLVDLETLLGLRKRGKGKLALVTAPRLFQAEPITAIPSSPPFRAALESVYRPDKWVTNQNNWAEFKLPCKTTPKNKVQIYISESNGVDLLPLSAALQILDSLGFEAAKMQLTFGAHLIKQENSWIKGIVLKATDLIEEIGLDKSKQSITKNLIQIASIAYALGRIVMQADWVEGKGKNQIDISTTQITPFWFISVEVIGQRNLLSGKIEKPDEIYIKIQAGHWAEKWLNKSGSKAKEALHPDCLTHLRRFPLNQVLQVKERMRENQIWS